MGEGKRMATIREIRGNLFDSTCQTLVNTVNCVGVMGRGIAFEFRHRYPDMFAAYERLCAERRLQPGLLQLWTKEQPWVLNFPTKNDWKRPSKLAFIEAGLRKFASTYADRGVTSIAFPRLGTANGGLSWFDVQPMMQRFLEPLPGLEVEIYEFDAGAGDRLFARLRARVARFDIADWQEHMSIGAKQAKVLQDAILSGSVARMTDLERINGIGEVTFDRVFRFAMSDSKRIVTANEIQPRLF
jgi:O-acetyl-ADP-ribose deacetylase (regulator of RNase III)